MIGLAVLVIIILAVVAFLATRQGGGESGSGPSATAVPKSELVYGEPTVQGAALPEYPEQGPDPALGMKAPVVTDQQFDGKKLTFPTPGKPAVIVFVAHWCPHCQREVPLLAQHLNGGGLPSDVELYAVSTGASSDNPNFPPSSWLNKEHWPVRTVADDSNKQIAKAFGLTGFPYFVVVDAQGNVVARASGEQTIEQFQQMLTKSRTAAVPPVTK